MKKLLVAILSALTILMVSGAVVFADRHHTANLTPTTIAEIHENGWDDQHVVLEGKFTEQIYSDIYTFEDTNGDSVKVDIDDDHWQQVPLNTPVRIFAEVDKEWHGGVELEVKRIQKI